MANKKIFTIQIDGLEKAYDNTIKLRDAIKSIDDIKLGIDGNINIVTNTINQSLSGLAEATVTVQQSVTELSTTINENTAAKDENAKKDEAQIGSIAKLKEVLTQLQKEYDNLGVAERNSTKGIELATKIKTIEKEVEKIDRQIKNNLDTLGQLGTTLDTISNGITTTSGMMSNLSSTFSSATEIMKTFGLESNTLNDIVTNLTEVIKTLNSIQALHTSIVSKDSIVMKGAALAKDMYTKATQGSNIALKGFKLALASTGIGAIIVLIGALITNFDNIKKAVADSVGGIEKFDAIMTKVEPVIAGVGNALVQFLLGPIKQIINIVGGLIDVISIFKEKGLDGFGDALDAIGDTASKAVEITIDSYNVVGNYQKAATEKMLSIEEKANKDRLTKDAKLKNDFIKNSEAKNGANWKFTKEGNAAYQAYFAAQALLYKKDSEEYLELIRTKDSYDHQFREANKPKGSSGPKRDYKQEQKDYEEALQGLKDATKEYQNEAIENENEFNRKKIEAQSSSKITESQKLEIENLKKTLDEKIKAREKALAEEIKNTKDSKEAQEKAAAAQIEIQQATLSAEQEIAQAEMDAVNNVLKTRQQAVTSLEEVHKKERELQQDKFKKEQTDIQKQYNDLLEKNILDKAKRYLLEKAFKEKMEALENRQASEKSKLDEDQQKEKTDATNKVKETEAQALLQKIDADNEFLASQQKITELLKEDKIERDGLGLINIKATKENYKKAIDADKEYLDELKKNKESKLEILDELIKGSEGDAELQAFYLKMKAEVLKSFEAESIKVQARMEENTDKGAKVLASKYEELYNKIKEKWDQVNTAMTAVGTALTSVLKGQLDELKEKQEEVSKQYDEAVEKHKASQEKLKSLEEEAKTASGGRAMVVQEQIARQMEANNELAAQEKDLAKQKEKLEKDAAKKEKQMKKVELGQQLITGIANIAMGITKALAMGPILGPIMAGIVGAMGAIQTATIAKQMSKLEDGGMLRGKRHTQGGMRIEGTNIEVEGDEYVVNRVSTSKNLGLIDYINRNRRQLKADDINSYFTTIGGDRQPINIPTKRMYEQGGMLTNLDVVDSINSPDSDKILEAISQINFKPVVSVVDITSAQNNLSEVKDIAGA